MTIGENIKRIRKKCGLTQKQLGEKCGMADSVIRRYESGAVNPKMENLKKIANALNVELYDIDESLFEIEMDRLNEEANKAAAINAFCYAFQIDDGNFFDSYNQLNAIGQKKAVESIKQLLELLSKIPEYQKSPVE